MKTLTEELTGETIDSTLFFQLLNIARVKREMLRPWQVLIKEDATKTTASGDTFETSKALPTDFSRIMPWTKTRPQMVLVSGDDELDYRQIAFGLRFMKRNVAGFFVIDLQNDLFFLTGSQSTAYTIHLFYLFNQADITTSSQNWLFPDEFHPLLPFDVARTYKGGIDYDDINARMVRQHNVDIEDIESAMNLWDSQLSLSSLGT